MRRRQVRLLLTAGILIAGQAATAQSISECIALREVGLQLVSKARRAEAMLVNEKCPKEEFRKKLNSRYEWAWETDEDARQKCREDWRKENKPKYVDAFGNVYRSEMGIKLAKSIEKLGVDMESVSCPTSDLKWARD